MIAQQVERLHQKGEPHTVKFRLKNKTNIIHVQNKFIIYKLIEFELAGFFLGFFWGVSDYLLL